MSDVKKYFSIKIFSQLSLIPFILIGIYSCQNSKIPAEPEYKTNKNEIPISNIALLSKKASATDNGFFDDYGIKRDASNAIDDNESTYWAGLESSNPQIMTITFNGLHQIDRIRIRELYNGGNTSYFTNADFEYNDGGGWKLLFNESKNNSGMDRSFSAVIALQVRIKIYATAAPTSWYNKVACIYSFEVNGIKVTSSNIALISLGATATDNGYFNDYGVERDASNAIDNNESTYWAGLQSSYPQTINITFDKSYKINRIKILELYGGGNVSYFTKADFEYNDGNGWKILFSESKNNSGMDRTFSAVIANQVRMKIYSVVTPLSWYNKVACIYNLEIYKIQ